MPTRQSRFRNELIRYFSVFDRENAKRATRHWQRQILRYFGWRSSGSSMGRKSQLLKIKKKPQKIFACGDPARGGWLSAILYTFQGILLLFGATGENSEFIWRIKPLSLQLRPIWNIGILKSENFKLKNQKLTPRNLSKVKSHRIHFTIFLDSVGRPSADHRIPNSNSIVTGRYPNWRVCCMARHPPQYYAIGTRKLYQYATHVELFTLH